MESDTALVDCLPEEVRGTQLRAVFQYEFQSIDIVGQVIA
jgi:hypothetical protein